MEADLPAVPVVGRLISTATLGAKVSLLGGHPLHIARCLEIGPVLSQTGGPGLEAATLIQVLCNARQEKANTGITPGYGDGGASLPLAPSYSWDRVDVFRGLKTQLSVSSKSWENRYRMTQPVLFCESAVV